MGLTPAPHIDPTAFVASTARIFGDVAVAANVVIMFGAVIRAETDRISIGERTNIQDNCVVHCDVGKPALIGAGVTVGHGAVIHGALVGDSCLVGIGSVALNGSELGEGAWLAAGSVLAEGAKIPPWTIAVGSPAKPFRELRPEEVDRQRSGVEEYLRLGDLYRSMGA